MAVVLQIDGDGASAEDLHEESRVLARLLSAQPELVVSRPEDGPVAPGERGSLLAIGQLLLSLISDRGVDALIGASTLYFENRRGVTGGKIVIKGENGDEVELEFHSFGPDQIVETTRRLRAALLSKAPT